MPTAVDVQPVVTVRWPVEGEGRRFSAILERLNDLSAQASLHRLVAGLLGLVMDVSAAGGVILYLFDADMREFVVAAVCGPQDISRLVGLRLKQSQGLVGEAAAGQEPLIFGDLFAGPHWLRAILPLRETSLDSFLLAPLHVEGSLFGVIQLINAGLPDLDLLKMLGQRLVLEIERIIKFDLQRRSNRRLQDLIGSLRENSTLLNRSQILKTATEQVTRLVNAEQSTIFLIDPSLGGLDLNVSYQAPLDAQAVQTENDPPCQQPAASGPPDELTCQIIESIVSQRWKSRPAAAPAGQGSQLAFTTHSAITVPLQSRQLAESGRTIGGLMALKNQGAAFDQEDRRLLEILAEHVSGLLGVADIVENANELYLDVIKSLVASLDAKDPYTQGHSLRVSEYAVSLAEALGMSPEEVTQVRIASLLHDVGKIGISDAILQKTGSLSLEEFEVMKTHTLIGGKIMRQVRVLEAALPGIIEHHERLDGSGYPSGLVGDEISLMGKIIAIADVFDAMTSDRPYRPAINRRAVLQYLLDNAGKLFDARAVEAFVAAAHNPCPGG